MGAVDKAEEAKHFAVHFAVGIRKRYFQTKGDFERLIRAETGHKDAFQARFMNSNLGKQFLLIQQTISCHSKTCEQI